MGLDPSPPPLLLGLCFWCAVLQQSRRLLNRVGCSVCCSFYWKCCIPEIHQVQNLKFMCPNSIISDISIWMRTARDTEDSEFLDLVYFGNVAFPVETVIQGAPSSILQEATCCEQPKFVISSQELASFAEKMIAYFFVRMAFCGCILRGWGW